MWLWKGKSWKDLKIIIYEYSYILIYIYYILVIYYLLYYFFILYTSTLKSFLHWVIEKEDLGVIALLEQLKSDKMQRKSIEFRWKYDV